MLVRSGVLETQACLAAVFDPATGKAEAFGARHGIPVVDGVDAVIGASDAVYVCTPTSTHAELVSRVVAAGRAVFCEKPLGVDLPSSVRLARDVLDAGVVNQVGLVLRSSPALLLLRELCRDPADGAVLSVVFRDDQYFPIRGQYRSTWRGDATLVGSGTLLEHSIHDLDILEWLFGPAVAVSARTRHVAGITDVEDVASVHLEFATGAEAHLVSVWHDVLGRPSQRRLEVFRQRGWYALEGDVVGPLRVVRSTEEEVAAASVDPVLDQTETWSREQWERHEQTRASGPAWQRGEIVEPEVYEGRRLIGELDRRNVGLRNPDEAFVSAVAAGQPASPGVLDALRAHVLADVAYRSAKAGGAWTSVPSGPGLDAAW